MKSVNKIIANLITGPIFAELKFRNMDKSQINELISPETIYNLAQLQLYGFNNNLIKNTLKELYK